MKSNGKNIKIDQIKICVKFESEWNTASSSVLRTVIALAKCVLRRIFEKMEREAGRCVTRMAC
jgi:hypothetical protein